MRKETIDAAWPYTAEHTVTLASQRSKLLYTSLAFHQKNADMAINGQIPEHNGKSSKHTETAGCHYNALNRCTVYYYVIIINIKTGTIYIVMSFNLI